MILLTSTNQFVTKASLRDYFHLVDCYRMIKKISKIISAYSKSFGKKQQMLQDFPDLMINLKNEYPELFNQFQDLITENKKETVLFKKFIKQHLNKIFEGDELINGLTLETFKRIKTFCNKYYDENYDENFQFKQIKSILEKRFNTNNMEEIEINYESQQENCITETESEKIETELEEFSRLMVYLKSEYKNLFTKFENFKNENEKLHVQLRVFINNVIDNKNRRNSDLLNFETFKKIQEFCNECSNVSFRLERIKSTLEKRFNTNNIEEVKKIKNSFIIALIIGLLIWTLIIGFLTYLIYYLLSQNQQPQNAQTGSGLQDLIENNSEQRVIQD